MLSASLNMVNHPKIGTLVYKIGHHWVFFLAKILKQPALASNPILGGLAMFLLTFNKEYNNVKTFVKFHWHLCSRSSRAPYLHPRALHRQYKLLHNSISKKSLKIYYSSAADQCSHPAQHQFSDSPPGVKRGKISWNISRKRLKCRSRNRVISTETKTQRDCTRGDDIKSQKTPQISWHNTHTISKFKLS